MARQLTAEHKAAMQAGRRNAQAQRKLDEDERKRQFRQWSLDHAKAWSEWLANCGKARHECEFCTQFRGITSAMPDMRGIDGERE